jgi:hypothetical protein
MSFIMKPHYKDLAFALLAVLLAYPVKEYSVFLSGLLFGAALTTLAKSGYQLFRARSQTYSK